MTFGWTQIPGGGIPETWSVFAQRVHDSSGTLILRGIIAVAFGLVALFLPGTALFAVVIAFGAYALIEGLFAFVFAMSRRPRSSRPFLILEGALGILAASIAFSNPRITAIALIYIVAAWALLIGVSKIAAALRLHREIRGEGLIILSGVGSMIFALILFVLPLMIGLVAVSVVGAYAIFLGVVLLRVGVRIRALERTMSEPTRAA